MQISKEDAMKVWLHEFGDVDFAKDFTGRKIKRVDYLVENQVGWVVTFVKPLSLGGPYDEGNVIIMNHITAYDKGDDYPCFEVAGVKYQAFYDKKGDFHYIEKVFN